MDIKKKINFGKIDYCGSGRKINELVVELRLSGADGNKPEFSASGMIYNSKRTDCVAGGQIFDDRTVLKAMKGNSLYGEIVRLWKRNHLNGMNAGTPEQEKCLKDHEGERDAVAKELFEAEWNAKKAEFGYSDDLKDWWMKKFFYHAPSHYDVSCEILRRNDLYEIELDGKPYRYGSGWLYRPISESDMAAIKKILAA